MEYNSSTRLTEPLTNFSFGTICYLQDQKRWNRKGLRSDQIQKVSIILYIFTVSELIRK